MKEYRTWQVPCMQAVLHGMNVPAGSWISKSDDERLAYVKAPREWEPPDGIGVEIPDIPKD